MPMMGGSLVDTTSWQKLNSGMASESRNAGCKRSEGNIAGPSGGYVIPDVYQSDADQ